MSNEIPIVPPPDVNRSDPPNWRHWTWWLRPIVAIPLMLFVLLLLSPFLVRAWHLAKVPDIADPFDVEAFLSETVDDKDNAFVDYRAADALLVLASLSRAEWDEVEAGWEKTSPPVRTWVTANRPALDLWRVGTGKEHSIDDDLQRLDNIDSAPCVGRDRDFARLVWLQGEREQSEGRMAEAWQWYRALMRFSRHVGERTGSIGRITGVAIHAGTTTRIERWASDPRTSDEELQLALTQLYEDYHLTRPFSETLKTDYTFLWKLERLDAAWKLRSPLLPTRSSWHDSRFVAYCLAQPEMSIRPSKLVIENWLAGGDAPRNSQRRITIIGRGDVLDVTAPGSGISGVKIPLLLEAIDKRSLTHCDATWDHFNQELARQEALRLTVACRLWFRRHGTFPAKLEDLVPDLLTELPVDPFSPSSEVFRYRRSGDEAVAYSLGLDETDDHGLVDLSPGIGYRDIGYRLVPPRIREQASEQKAVDEP